MTDVFLLRKLLFRVVFMAFFISCNINGQAQNIKVVKKIKIYRETVSADSMKRMIDLTKYVPFLVADLRYATVNNFTGVQLYPENARPFLRRAPALALRLVADSLRRSGIGLKIFDAYRPYAATKKMWDLVHDERYVANPAKGSGHNRGLAVDLTLIDLKTGKELDMGTGFDHFSDTAHHSFTQLPAPVLANRRLLRTTMEAAGFRALETEWWHYAWPNDRGYEVMDVGFAKFR